MLLGTKASINHVCRRHFGKLLNRIQNFDQTSIGLEKDFSLISFASLKGWGCKVPAATLFQYLKDIGDGSIAKETPDCSVTKYLHDPTKHLISTTDFFYPLVNDPYMQGRIACCNTLSDVYAMGIDRVDHMLMILGVSLKMQEH